MSLNIHSRLVGKAREACFADFASVVVVAPNTRSANSVEEFCLFDNGILYTTNDTTVGCSAVCLSRYSGWLAVGAF